MKECGQDNLSDNFHVKLLLIVATEINVLIAY